MVLNFELVVSDQLFSVVLAAYKWFKISAPVVGWQHMWQLDLSIPLVGILQTIAGPPQYFLAGKITIIAVRSPVCQCCHLNFLFLKIQARHAALWWPWAAEFFKSIVHSSCRTIEELTTFWRIFEANGFCYQPLFLFLKGFKRSLMNFKLAI